MNTFIPRLADRPYESQVMLLISSLAIVRVAVALTFDLISTDKKVAELLTDALLLLVFGGLFILGYLKSNVQTISPIPALFLMVLLALNFLEFGGIHGDSRFNYYGGFFVTILLYHGRTLAILLFLQCTLMIGLVAYTIIDDYGTNFLFLAKGTDQNDFIFILLAIGTLAFYFKDMTVGEIKVQEALTDKLTEKAKEAKKLNHELVEQGQQLSFAQHLLESEINRRSQALLEKQKAIETYIQLNSQLLRAPMQELTAAVIPIGNNLPLNALLAVSHAELIEVVRNINTKLDAREELNRTKVK